MAVTLNQLTVSLCLLEWIEVLALDVLDQCQLCRRRLVDIPNDCGDLMQLSSLGCTPATLPGDDHIAVAVGAKQDRLQNSVLAD